MIPAKVRAALYERAGQSCERCGATNAHTYSAHHRRPRGMGGSKDPATNSLDNLLLLCGSGTSGCHGWVESNREESLRLGFLVRQGQDPADVPVMRVCSPHREECCDQTACRSCPRGAA